MVVVNDHRSKPILFSNASFKFSLFGVLIFDEIIDSDLTGSSMTQLNL